MVARRRQKELIPLLPRQKLPWSLLLTLLLLLLLILLLLLLLILPQLHLLLPINQYWELHQSHGSPWLFF